MELEVWILTGTWVLVQWLIIFLSKDRFYDHDINRWRPGINLPALRGAQGKKINFKKLQNDIRIYVSAIIALIMIPTFLLTLGGSKGALNEQDVLFWVYFTAVMVVSLGFAIWTFAIFPKKIAKYEIK